MGSFGAGKSTLLYALSGMDAITGGNVTFRGQEISKLSEKKMAQIRAKAGSTKEIREKTDMLLLKMHAGNAKDRLPSQVSGSEAQRAAIARGGENLTLTIKGFYEDVYMGSSMIGMKGFLISEEDRAIVLDVILHAGIDALARDGAMFHIFPQKECNLTVSELNSLLNEQTAFDCFKPQHQQYDRF